MSILLPVSSQATEKMEVGLPCSKSMHLNFLASFSKSMTLVRKKIMSAMTVWMWLSHLFKVKTLYLSQEFGERETSRKFYFLIREVFFFFLKEYLKDIHCVSDTKPKGSSARTISH